MTLVIKGAQYFERDSDIILIPHYTGVFWMVDCDRYYPLDELKEMYSDGYVESVMDNYIEFEDKKYYYAEYRPWNVTEDWELISDLSELEFNE